MDHTRDFSGKNVYISGGSSGIGLAAAELFASLEANVFVFSVDGEKALSEAISQIEHSRKSPDQRFEAAVLDVSDHEEVNRTLNRAVDSFGTPYVLINSAGIGGGVYFEKLSYERFDKTIKVNLYGTRNTVAALLPSMKQCGGYIVNVASMSGLINFIGYTAYGTSKFAVVGFSEALRSELKHLGIFVSVLCPPQVATPLLEKTDKDKPPETKRINDNAGVLPVGQVVNEMLEGMLRDKFIIIPGKKARLFHLIDRVLPRLRERITDGIIRKARKDKEHS